MKLLFSFLFILSTLIFAGPAEASQICKPDSIKEMQISNSGKSWKEVLGLTKDSQIYFDQVPLVNAKRLVSGRKITVITKEKPWSGVTSESKIFSDIAKLGSTVEVIQLSWKASEEWNMMAEKGLIKYKYLGELFSSYCLGLK